MSTRVGLIIITILLLVLLDWGIKRIIILNGYNYVVNPGISLGLANGSALFGLLFNLFGLGLATFITRPVFAKNMLVTDFGLIFIWAGGIANLIDRIFYGGAVDYLNFFNLTVFNLADLLITIAFLILIYQFLLKPNAKV